MSQADIAEAIGILPFDPNRATQLLHLHRPSPHFFPSLRDISCAYSLYSEAVRHSAIVILARFARKTLRQHPNEAIYYVDRLASYCLHILSSQFVSLSSKRALTSALTDIISHKCFSQLDFNQAAQTILIGTAPEAIFILMESAMDSTMSDSDKINILRNHLLPVIRIGQKQLVQLMCCFRESTIGGSTIGGNTIGEIKIGESSFRGNQFRGNSNDSGDPSLLAITKNSQEGNSTIMKCLSLVIQQAQKQQSHSTTELLERVCMGDELPEYFCTVFSFEQQAGRSGTFATEIVSGMNREHSRHLNAIKGDCLRVFSQILDLAEKCFNVVNTPKRLFQMLPELMNQMISDLLICSDAEVYARLEGGDAHTALGGMFRLLQKCISFSELQRPLSTLSCEQILRLTIAYFMSTTTEINMFYEAPEEYVVFLEYVCMEQTFKEIKSEEMFPTICLKKDLGGFVRAMCRHVAGFTSCLFELTYDLIVVRLTSLRTSQKQHIMFFQLHYRVPDDLMQQLSLEAALLCMVMLSPCLQQRSSAIQPRMNSLIDLVELSVLTQLQAARVFTFICSFAKLFVSLEVRLRNYRFVQEAFNITLKKPAARILALKSVQVLFEKVLEETDIDSLHFAGRILEHILKEFSETSSQEDIAELLLTAIHNKNMSKYVGQYVGKYVGSLFWINSVFERVLQKINNSESLSSNEMKNMLMIMLQLSQMAESSLQKEKGQMPESRELNRYLELLTESIGKKILDKSGLMGDVDLDEDDSDIIEKQGKYVSWLMRLEYYCLEDMSSISAIMLNCLTVYQLLTLPARTQVFNVALELTIRVGLHHLNKDDAILRWLKQLLAGTEEAINQACVFVLSVAHQNAIDAEYFQMERNTLQLIVARMKKCLIYETEKYRDSPFKALKHIVVLRMYCCFLLGPQSDMISVIHQELNELCFSEINVFDLNALLAGIWKLLPKLSHADMSIVFDFLIKMFEKYCFYEQNGKAEHANLVNRPLQLRTALAQTDPFQKLSQFVGKCRNYECISEGGMISEHFSISEHWREVDGLINTVRRISAFRTVKGKPRVINRIVRPI